MLDAVQYVLRRIEFLFRVDHRGQDFRQLAATGSLFHTASASGSRPFCAAVASVRFFGLYGR